MWKLAIHLQEVTSTEIVVSFSPIAIGDSTAVLVVASDAQDSPQLTIDLQGEGLAPLDCADTNPCTDDLFDPEAGRCLNGFHERACDDRNQCTIGDRCVRGACLGEARLDCPAAPHDCVLSSCDPEQGCVYEPMPDHSACGACGECLVSVCIQDKDCIVVEGGCGCGSGGSGPGSTLLLVAFWLLATLILRSSPHE